MPQKKMYKPPLFRSSLLLQFISVTIVLLGCTAAGQTSTVAVDVGVVLDLSTVHGRIGLSCIDMSLSDFYASPRGASYRTRLVLNPRDSQSTKVGAAAAALDLIKNEQVKAILGPEDSMQAEFVIVLGNISQVPIISFSATSPSLSSARYPYFVRAARNDSAQVKAISAILQAFKWKQAVLMYVDNEFGEGIIPFLIDALEEVDTRVPYRSVISPSATDHQILEELHKLMTMQTRVFIIHMLPNLASRIFTKAKEIGMMDEGYAWIMTNGITDLLSAVDPSVVTESMQGVLGVQTYVPPSKELENFKRRWKMKFQRDNPNDFNASMNVFGLWGYDATQALAMAIEKIGITNFTFRNPNKTTNATDVDTVGLSEKGPVIRRALVNTKFRGLTGDFDLKDGQLQSSVFQIVNINGNAARQITYWTPDNGFLKNLTYNTSSSTSYNTSSRIFETVIWPGDTTRIPKGWEIPSKGKRLSVGVPVKNGFNEFVKVTRDNTTNGTTVDGYCIRVFDAVVEALPYSILYDYIPFAKPDGKKSAGSYNDLVYQVFLGNYDIVVGDVTIVANRSQYVEFTLPYTESGVSMVVPYQGNMNKNAWVFLKPLTWDLWLTSGCFFIFIGLVVWILEHRINEDFRGPAAHQVGTSFMFSFSTMVFAHRERVLSNLSRFVVIVWIFVVLILTQSYTASLTSMLTVQKLQPTISNVNDLIKRGDTVGYQDGSFVYGLLKEMKFEDEKLKVYNSPEELHALFTNGSANGGISAAFDEVPYMKLFLAKYCDKYTMVSPTFKTAGFGFAFPLGSPLVSDVSRAILNVTQGPKMASIEESLSPQTKCPDSSTSLSSTALSMDSFWGLFLIAGVSAFLALAIFTIRFLKKNWNRVPPNNPTNSMCQKLKNLWRLFIQRDLSSSTLRRGGFRDIVALNFVAEAVNNVEMVARPAGAIEESSRSVHSPSSSSSNSNHAANLEAVVTDSEIQTVQQSGEITLDDGASSSLDHHARKMQ